MLLNKFFELIFITTLGTSTIACGCHSTLPKKPASESRSSEVKHLIKGRILIDTDFSAPERKLIAAALKMWTDPLGDSIRMEISEDPGAEYSEMLVQQRLVLKQERVAAGITNPDDAFTDPHDSWDSFDPRTPFWSAPGCSDHAVILRLTSSDPKVRLIDQESKSTLVGLTSNSCHDKMVIIIADRIDDERGFIAVVAHELGHLFGLKHDFKRAGTLMFPDKKFAAHCVVARDVESFCDRWGCDTRGMKMTRDCAKTL
jgi:hypothetical protein